MEILLQGKIGNCFQLIKVGTNNSEKVAEHTVAEPIRSKVGQTVKYVKCATTGRFNHIKYLCYKSFKAFLRVKIVDFYSAILVYQLRVFCKSEVDSAPSKSASLITYRSKNRKIVMDPINLPDNIIARQ